MPRRSARLAAIKAGTETNGNIDAAAVIPSPAPSLTNSARGRKRPLSPVDVQTEGSSSRPALKRARVSARRSTLTGKGKSTVPVTAADSDEEQHNDNDDNDGEQTDEGDDIAVESEGAAAGDDDDITSIDETAEERRISRRNPATRSTRRQNDQYPPSPEDSFSTMSVSDSDIDIDSDYDSDILDGLDPHSSMGRAALEEYFHNLEEEVLSSIKPKRNEKKKNIHNLNDPTLTASQREERDRWLEAEKLAPKDAKAIFNFNALAVSSFKLPIRWHQLDELDKASARERYGAKKRDGAYVKRFGLKDDVLLKHPELSHFWTTFKADPPIEPALIPQPPMITRALKPFQLQGVDWMMKQEQTKFKGGLLGDEMGMGKTIQAVSLIMSDYPAPKPTLVLVPPVALMQWQNEMTAYTDGKLKILVCHGSNAKTKHLTLETIHQYDVILVSYNTLESVYRKQTKGWSRGLDIVKEDSAYHATHWHRIILDEAHSIKQRTTGVAKACFALESTYRWCLSGTPVQNRVGEFFSLLRFLQVRPLADYICRQCPCSLMHWEVDASYMCRGCGHAGSVHVSFFNSELLNPLTNGDVRLRNLALAKLHTITSRVMLRRLKQNHMNSMELPPKSVVVNRQFFGDVERDFSQSIMTNSSRQFDTYVSRGVMLNNYANIFGLIMQMRQVANHPDLILRKHGTAGDDGIANVIVCCICREPAEDAIRSKCKHEFCRSCVQTYVQQSENLLGGDSNAAECPQCHLVLSIDWEQPALEQQLEDGGGDEEPGYMAGVGTGNSTSIVNRIKMDNWTSSTKIEQLIYELYKLRSRKRTLKSIVFSQFTSMLQLIQWRLHRAGFKTVMLDGGMSPAQRQRSIDYFMNNADVEVFLVSLKAGGVALNLTEASRVFIVDPWWNPAAEWQSADRCHRIGQRRPCMITRLCIEDSVESRIVLLQEKKAKMIRCTVNNDAEAIGSLTPEDLQFLFRGD